MIVKNGKTEVLRGAVAKRVLAAVIGNVHLAGVNAKEEYGVAASE